MSDQINLLVIKEINIKLVIVYKGNLDRINRIIRIKRSSAGKKAQGSKLKAYK